MMRMVARPASSGTVHVRELQGGRECYTQDRHPENDDIGSVFSSHLRKMSYLFQSICLCEAQLRPAAEHHVLCVRQAARVPGIAEPWPRVIHVDLPALLSQQERLQGKSMHF